MNNQLPEYNGWTNKPTWLFNLYFEPTNDEFLIEQAIEILEESDQDKVDNFEERDPKYQLADNMKGYFEEMKYENMEDGSNFYDELMEFAFAYINWDEIAGHVIEQAKDNI